MVVFYNAILLKWPNMERAVPVQDKLPTYEIIVHHSSKNRSLYFHLKYIKISYNKFMKNSMYF